jgi:hypothetical protein
VKEMTEKSNKFYGKTAPSIDGSGELAVIDAATVVPEDAATVVPEDAATVVPEDAATVVPEELAVDTRAIFKERVRGYLLSRKSPITLSIAEIASRLRLTDVEANVALLSLADEGDIAIALVRIVVTVKEG